MRLTLSALILTVMLAPVMADPAPVRVAVISDAATQDLAALVTTELSGNPDITLVERNDLAKAGDELKLQQLAGSDSVALGKLIGADGLLFIAKTPNGLQVRFTAVGLGYALFDDQVPASLDLAQEAKALAHRVEGYAPKLKLSPAEAVPISVLNLRADYATGNSTTMERQLTLLLESRLASLPNYVVLERRHGWSVSLERSLSANPAPLLHGAYVVDGTLSFPLQNQGTGELTIHLRLRSPNNQQTLLEIHGPVNDLPGLVEQMAAEIQKTTGTNGNPPPWQPQKEAREYLEEGIWGWQHHADDAAMEALDSAELLGETAPDLIGIRIILLCRRAAAGGELFLGRKEALPDSPLSLDQRTDDMLQAIREMNRYAADKMESKLEMIQSPYSFDLRTGELQEKTITVASKLLVNLEEANNPRADEIRRELRTLTGYDPMHGKLGMSFRNQIRDVFADEWAGSLAEELAYYHLLFTLPNQYLPPGVMARQGQEFCERFLKTPEEEKAAFDQLVQSLKDDPAGKLSALLIMSCSKDEASASAAYKSYLDELWNRREQLMGDHEARVEWTNARPVSDDARKENAKQAIPLLRYYLTHLDDLRDGEYPLVMMCRPEGWSEADATAIWADYLAFKARVNASWKKDGRNEEALITMLAGFEKPILVKFPQLAAPEAPAASQLAVTRFWQPGLVAGTHDERFIIPDCEATTNGICVLGSYHANINGSALYEISLPDFKTERLDLPYTQSNTQGLRVTPEAFYVKYFKNVIGGQFIARFDRKARTWIERQTNTFSNTGFWAVNGSLYLSMQEGGLARYDWDKDEVTLLASPRRKPSQNQFDDQSELRIGDVFAGPGNQACFTTGEGTYFIQDQPGEWRTVFDSERFTEATSSQDGTLIWSQEGEVVLLDPNQPAPRYLMTPAQPHYRKIPPLNQKAVQEMAPWAGQALWDAPEKGLKSNGNFSNNIGIHGDKLYDLVSPILLTGDYELLVFSKEAPTPRRVPLKFEMDGATRSALAPIYNRTDNLAPEWTLDKIIHPGSPFFGLKPVTTNQGLCLVSYVGGFWFVPYNDIDDYLKTHPANPSDASSLKTSQTSAHAGGDTIDPGSPNSFR